MKWDELTPRQQDALVYLHLNRWTVPPELDLDEIARTWPVPTFTRSIAEAWLVVRRMKELDPVRFNLSLYEYTYNRTYASFVNDAEPGGRNGVAEGNGEHCTPDAICHAALLALGIDI